MTDTTLPFVPPLQSGGESYLEEGHTLASWLTTTDHKRIAILYALSITVFFFIGGIAIGLVRLELISPTGWFMTSDQYNRLFTLHGIIMVWFFLVPSIPATMGNFLVPMMIGAPDVAFPRLNLMSWYIYRGRRRVHDLRASFRRSRYRLDLLSAILLGLFALQRRLPRRSASSSSAFPRSQPASISSPRFTCCVRPA